MFLLPNLFTKAALFAGSCAIVAAALGPVPFNAQVSTISMRFSVGLPSPLAAALVAAFVWFGGEAERAGLGGLALALMVSRFFAITVSRRSISAAACRLGVCQVSH